MILVPLVLLLPSSRIFRLQRPSHLQLLPVHHCSGQQRERHARQLVGVELDEAVARRGREHSRRRHIMQFDLR